MLVAIRIVSLCFAVSGLTLLFLSVLTECWWQQATPVPGPDYIKFSFIYQWKGLHRMCRKIPPATTPTCKSLKDLGLEDGRVSAVRYFLYVAIAFGCIEIIVVIIALLITSRFFMDFITFSSSSVAFLATVGLSIYTNSNPTLASFFRFYGYSYISGWLGATCFLLSALLALLSRLDVDGQTFLTQNFWK